MERRTLVNEDGTSGEVFILLNFVEAGPLLTAKYQGEELQQVGCLQPHGPEGDDPCWTGRPVLRKVFPGVLIRQRWAVG